MGAQSMAGAARPVGLGPLTLNTMIEGVTVVMPDLPMRSLNLTILPSAMLGISVEVVFLREPSLAQVSSNSEAVGYHVLTRLPPGVTPLICSAR